MAITLGCLLLLLLIAPIALSEDKIDLHLIDNMQSMAEEIGVGFYRSVIKKTWLNNQIQLFAITTNPRVDSLEDLKGQRVVILTSMLHAREETATFFLQKLVTRILTDIHKDNELKYLLTQLTLIFVPFVNIDSIIYYNELPPREGGNVRKNMNKSWKEICKRVSDRGVDINRNFDYNYGTIATSKDQCGEQYRGEHAFSEPESMAIKQIYDNFKVVMSIDIHSYGDLWIYPYASVASPDKIKSHKLYPRYERIFKIFNETRSNYANCYESLEYTADGVVHVRLSQYIDWALQQNAVSFAFQFGASFTDPGIKLTQGLRTMLEVLKSNYNLIGKYQNQNGQLCLQSLANVPNKMAISNGNESIIQVMDPNEWKCFPVGGANQTVTLKYEDSQIAPEIVVVADLPRRESKQEDNWKDDQPKTWMEAILEQAKVIVLVVGVLCLISSICGMSIFFEGSRGMQQRDEEMSNLSTNEFIDDAGEGMRSMGLKEGQ